MKVKKQERLKSILIVVQLHLLLLKKRMKPVDVEENRKETAVQKTEGRKGKKPD